MKALLVVVLSVVFGSVLAPADPTPSFIKNRLLSPFHLSDDNEGPAPMLLELSRGQGNLSKTSGIFLPNRVYGIYHVGAKAWVYALSTFHGPLPKPLELLYKGSVLPGKYLGASNPLQRYRLSENYLWIPTDEKESYSAVIPERSNEIKRITYLVPPLNPDDYEETLPKLPKK